MSHTASKHRRMQARQGATLAHNLPLKTGIIVVAVAASAMLVLLVNQLISG